MRLGYHVELDAAVLGAPGLRLIVCYRAAFAVAPVGARFGSGKKKGDASGVPFPATAFLQPNQWPLSIRAATVKNSSVVPDLAPWLKYQPCSPGYLTLGSEALVAWLSCMSTMVMLG